MVAPERRIDRPRARPRPALDQGEVLARDLRPLIIAASLRWASPSRAISISPEVSRSSRCTIGSLGLAATEEVAEDVDERRAAMAGSRVDDEPRGFVDHREAIVAMHDPRRGGHVSAARAGSD